MFTLTIWLNDISWNEWKGLIMAETSLQKCNVSGKRKLVVSKP